MENPFDNDLSLAVSVLLGPQHLLLDFGPYDMVYCPILDLNFPLYPYSNQTMHCQKKKENSWLFPWRCIIYIMI